MATIAAPNQTERSADEIKKAQERLRRFGYEGPLDGIVGEATAATIRRAQTELKLPTTGLLDDRTFERLMDQPAPRPKVPERPRLRVLSDLAKIPEGQDPLGFDAYAEALAGIIDNPETDTPLTIAISAPWGAGKSTLAGMVAERLEAKPAAGGSKPHVTCTFNAWMHDDAKNLGSAFAAEIARAAHRRRPLLWRILRPIPWGLSGSRERTRQLIWLGLVVLLLLGISAWFGGLARVVAVLGAFELLSDSQRKMLNELGTNKAVGTFAAAALAMAGKILLTMGSSLSSFVKDPETAASRGTLTRVREHLGSLIRQATPRGSRFVIFVDDLERCRPPRSVDLLEVVNLLLGHEGVVTVIIADMPAVAACAEIKYRTLAERYSPSDRVSVPPHVKSAYGRLYLQKIVQLQLDIPPQDPAVIKKFVDGLVVEPAKPAPAAPEPWGARIERRLRRAGVDLAAGLQEIITPPESRKLWALGGLGAAVLFADALGAVRGTAALVAGMLPAAPASLAALAAGEPTALWVVRAAAVGLAVGAWIAFLLARRERRVALPREVSVVTLGLVAGVVMVLDRWAFDPIRGMVANAEWYWLKWTIAAQGTSWFWTSLALTVAGGGLYFVLSRAAGPPADAAGPGGAGEGQRAAFSSWWLLGTALVALTIDRMILVEGGAVWRVFDGGNADAPALYAVLMSFWRTVAIATILALVARTIAACWASGREARLARARRAFDRSIENGQEPAPDANLDPKQFVALVKERRLLALINDSVLLAEAYRELLPHLHRLPRNAKRAINRLRLLLYVAYARHAFGGEPALTHLHIGRWVAFQEHFPEVAALMIGNPGLMDRLERAGNAAERQELFKLMPEQMAKSFAEDPDLQTFLADERLRLGGVMARLIHFPDARPPKAAPANASA